MAAPVAQKRQPIYMCEMMERLGIEPGGGMAARVGPEFTLWRFTVVKLACQKKPAASGSIVCRHRWRFAPGFCPNADIFFELQIDQPRASEDIITLLCPSCRHLMRVAAPCRSSAHFPNSSY